jgi:hypothetical protein
MIQTPVFGGSFSGGSDFGTNCGLRSDGKTGQRPGVFTKSQEAVSQIEVLEPPPLFF